MLIKMLEDRFNVLTHETSDSFTYLGMLIEVTDDGNYSIGMEDYQKNAVVTHFGKEKSKVTTIPASKELFSVNTESKALNIRLRKQFHSSAARVLRV